MNSSASQSWARTRADWLSTRRRVAPRALVRSAFTAEWGFRFVVVILASWLAGLVVPFEHVLTFLNLFGFAAAVAGLAWPSVGLLGVGVLCALEPISGPLLATGGLWRWNTLNYFLLLVFLIHLPMIARLRDPHSRLLQILMLVLAAGLLVTPSLFIGVQAVFSNLAAFGLVVYFARASSDREAWYWMGISTGVLGAVGCLVYFARFESLPGINRNIWCLFPLTALFATCLAIRHAQTSKEQMLLGGLAAINYVWVFLSASRGGLATASLCMLFLFFQLPGLSRRILFAGVGVVIALVVLSQFSQFQEFALGRISEMLDTTKSTSDRTSNRSDLALAGWHIFLAHPLGAGTGGFGAAQAELALFSWSRTRDFAAHSGWIRTLAENGVPGILVLAGYVFSFALVGWRERRRGVFGLGLLVTSLFCINLLTYEFDSKGLWLLAFGATLVLHPREFATPAALRSASGGRAHAAPH